MNRPAILPKTAAAPSGGQIDGLDLHDLGVLIHTIDSRGMPPIVPRRIARPSGHGAHIYPEYYTPRPLVISGQMIADTHTDLIENQRALSDILSGFSSPSRTFRVIDPINPDTYYECIYDGSCGFQDPVPRTKGRVCQFAFNALANPPWRQASARSLVRQNITAQDQALRVDVDGNVPADYILTLENPGWQVELMQGIHSARFVPEPGLEMETANGRIGPSVASRTNIAPSDISGAMFVSAARETELEYRLNIADILPSMAFYILFRPKNSSTDLAANFETVFFIRNPNDYPKSILLEAKRHADAEHAAWKLSVGNQTFFFDLPGWQAGGLIGIGVNIGGGTEAGVDIFRDGAWADGHQNNLPNNLSPLGPQVDIWLSRPSHFVSVDIYAFHLFGRKLTRGQHRLLHQYPTQPYTAPQKAVLTIPHIDADALQFDTEKYASTDERYPFFPDSGSALLPLSPGPNSISVRHISPAERFTLNRMLVPDMSMAAGEVGVTARSDEDDAHFVAVDIGADEANINSVIIGDYLLLEGPGSYIAGKVTGIRGNLEFTGTKDFLYDPIRTSGVTSAGVPVAVGDATLKFLRHSNAHSVGVAVGWRDSYL